MVVVNKDFAEKNWICRCDKYPDKYCGKDCEYPDVPRFVLGEYSRIESQKTLICFGINPSTAIPNKLDPTLRRVRKYACDNNYDSWIMLNIYPQRETNPRLIDVECKSTWSNDNEKQICKLFSEIHCADIWYAWGDSIELYPYLETLRDRIQKIVNQSKHKDRILYLSEINTGKVTRQLTKKGNPRHPLDRVLKTGRRTLHRKV